MPKPIHVLLTVPHAECHPLDLYQQHTCDYTALSNAKALSYALRKNAVHSVILRGNINRKTTDLNRSAAKSTKFHHKIDHFLLTHPPPDLVLDIHSGDFPSNQSLTLLDLDGSGDDLLISAIKHTIPSSVIYRGSDQNYIIKKTHEHHIPSVLIEFNEKFSYSSVFFENLSQTILKVIK